jgi:hypothetical protein
MEQCRCGHAGGSPHQCHGHHYKCTNKPTKQYFYGPQLSSLAGVQMKVQVFDTWACDKCWREFNVLRGLVQEAGGDSV